MEASILPCDWDAIRQIRGSEQQTHTIVNTIINLDGTNYDSMIRSNAFAAPYIGWLLTAVGHRSAIPAAEGEEADDRGLALLPLGRPVLLLDELGHVFVPGALHHRSNAVKQVLVWSAESPHDHCISWTGISRSDQTL